MHLVEHAYEESPLPPNYVQLNTIDSYGLVAQDLHFVYLVFRGTEDLHDILHNVNFNLIEHPFGNVHAGAYNLFKELNIPQLPTNLRLQIMGHSLGAMLAMFAAIELYHLRPKVTLYGAPRVGDKTFAYNYNLLVPDTTRIVNTEDIITTLPLPPTYCHAGTPVCFTESLGSLYNNHRMSLYASF